MHWKIKASLQKLLHVTALGDKLNHIPATLQTAYHKNVCIYQAHECLRKLSETPLQFSSDKKMNALEIGTGYSLIAPVVLFLLGFDKIITVDISKDVTLKSFQKQLSHLEASGFLAQISTRGTFSVCELQSKVEVLKQLTSLDEVLQFCHIIYLPNYTLQAIEDECNSFDYICSQVVFEHISPDFLKKIFQKMKKWLTKDGFSVHTINFIDHFANPGFFQDKRISEFNFLKYSDKIWNFWAGNAIAYTNRLSYLYYLELCEANQLNILDFKGENYRAHHPLTNEEIHPDIFRKYTSDVDAESLCKFQRGTLIFTN